MFGKIAIAAITIILSLLYQQGKKRRISNVYLMILIFLLSITFAYREYFYFDGLGNDYYSYKEWFAVMDVSRLGLRFNNIGYDILIVAVKSIYNNFHFFLFICALIINSLVYAFIIKYSRDFVFSSVLYVCLIYFSSFNIMRQWIACGIYLFAFRYLLKKEWKKYCLLIIVAATFHTSVLAMLLLYPIINLNFSLLKKTIAICVISLFSYFQFNTVFNLIIQIADLIGLSYSEKYGTATDLDIGNLTPFFITAMISIGLLFLNYRKKLSVEEERYATLGVVAAGLSLLNPVNIIFNRLSVYLFVSCIITLPIMEKYFVDNGSREIFKILMGILAFLVFII